jgi:hypothetical protein
LHGNDYTQRGRKLRFFLERGKTQFLTMDIIVSPGAVMNPREFYQVYCGDFLSREACEEPLLDTDYADDSATEGHCTAKHAKAAKKMQNHESFFKIICAEG